MRIVNEPTAAAMAYGIDKLKGTRNILVFDLGGGTFDVTVLTVDNGVFEVLATNGDTHLGGEDIDKALVNYFMKVFKKRTGLQIKAKNHRAIQKLRHAVNQAKHVLSSEVSTKVQVDALFKGKDLDEKLTRANFEVSSLFDCAMREKFFTLALTLSAAILIVYHKENSSSNHGASEGCPERFWTQKIRN